MSHISMLFSPSLTLIYLLLLSLAVQVDAAKITVDDSDPAIHYYQQWAQGPGCSYCWAQPDPAQAYGGTWHDAYKADSATNPGPLRMFNYTFRGHGAPYHGTRGSAGATFYIDGVSAGGYNLPIEAPTDPPTYQYNAMIGSQNNLPDGTHTLTLYVTYDQPNFIFDYLVVTNSDPEPVTTSSMSSTSSTTGTSAAASSTTTSNSTSLSTSTLGSSTMTRSNSTSLQTISSLTVTVSITKSREDQPTDGANIPVGSISNNHSDASPDASKRLSIGATVGIALGGVSLLFLLLLLLLWWRRQEKHKRFSEGLGVKDPFGVGNGSEKSMIAPLVSTESSSDAHHRTLRDVKAPLPIGDNGVNQQEPVRERHKPDLPPHDGFVNYSHSHVPAHYQQQQQQSVEDEGPEESNHHQPAPWFQHTEGSHPVEALQQNVPPSSPHSP
ncbi:hypothetical protein CPB86DRAFT_797426 [Serendipita vermifera]|nr:hypothetical protein CPB86DRAFT_797426 [Serendipita vermifera]